MPKKGGLWLRGEFVFPLIIAWASYSYYREPLFSAGMALGAFVAGLPVVRPSRKGCRFIVLGVILAVLTLCSQLANDDLGIAAALAGLGMGVLAVEAGSSLLSRSSCNSSKLTLCGLAVAFIISFGLNICPVDEVALLVSLIPLAVGLCLYGEVRRATLNAVGKATEVTGSSEPQKDTPHSDDTASSHSQPVSRRARSVVKELGMGISALVPFLVIFFIFGAGRSYPENDSVPFLNETFHFIRPLCQLVLIATFFLLFKASPKNYSANMCVYLPLTLIGFFFVILLFPNVESAVPFSFFTVFFFYLLWLILEMLSKKIGMSRQLVGVGFCAVNLVNYLGYLLGVTLGLGINSDAIADALIYVIIIAVASLCLYPLALRLNGSAKSEEAADPSHKAEDKSQERHFFTQKAKYLADKKGLTERETEVMLLFCRGRSRKAVSEILYLSENTVGTHLRRVYEKIGVHTRQQLLDAIESVADVQLEREQDAGASDDVQ